ncbi:MAG: hypothetical protein LHW60_02405 [Candidatus Cloacimonetes bacterium]|jgi:hydrogenase-4 component E|nr:hypothetical protein [Candidatus Cloacimonadota bacterium]NLO44483.1 hypothetical protein [Candidatus Cloacimonadota bacterium]
MIQVLVLIFGITLLFASVTNMLNTLIRILAAQGFILFLITIFKSTQLNWLSFAFIALETLVFKAILIPWFLHDTIRKNDMRREVEAHVSNFFSLALMSLIFLGSFALASFSGQHSGKLFPLEFGIAFATILKGMFMIIANKKLITHLIGYLFMENGIFMLSISVGGHLPQLISLGISLDLILTVLIAVVFLSRIKTTFLDKEINPLEEQSSC